MAKVKKYQWGTFSASGANPQMINPGNAALKQYTTTSSSSIPDGSLPTSGDISQVAYSKDKLKGPSFKDKAGAFMGNYGGAITQAAGSLMPLLMKKPDPNAKPYKKGSKLIKYQAGLKDASLGDPEDLNAYFGRILGKNKPTQVVEPQGEVGLSRKEAADLMRAYNKANKNNPNVIGNIDEEEVATREKTLKNLTPSNKTKAPITYNKDSFAGPSREELETGKKKEISERAERARNNYETRLAAEAARNKYEKEQAIEGEKNMVGPSREDLIKYKKEADEYDAAIKSGISPSLTTPTFTKESVERAKERQAGGPVSTEKKPILYKETPNRAGLVSFKDMTSAQQKQYRAGMASGNKFTVEGIGEYAAADKSQQSQSARMATKGNKSNFSKRSSVDDILDKYDRTKPGSIAYEKIKNATPDNFWKDIYESRKSTVGKNFGTLKTPFAGAREDNIQNTNVKKNDNSSKNFFSSLFKSKEDIEKEKILQKYLDNLDRKK